LFSLNAKNWKFYKKVQFDLQFAQDLIQFKLGFAKKCNILVKQKMQKFGFKNKNAIKQNTALNKKGGSFFLLCTQQIIRIKIFETIVLFLSSLN